MRTEEEINTFISTINRLNRLEELGQSVSMNFKGQEIKGEVAKAISNTLEWVLEDETPELLGQASEVSK